MSTAALTSIKFRAQLAALLQQATASQVESTRLRATVSAMQALTVEASRSLFNLPRLETAVRGAVAGEAELRAALAAAEERHAAELRSVREAMEAQRIAMEAQRVATEANTARLIAEAIRAARTEWTAALAVEAAARTAAVAGDVTAREAAVVAETAARTAAIAAERTARETADAAERAAREDAVGREAAARTAAIAAERTAWEAAVRGEAAARTAEATGERGAREAAMQPLSALLSWMKARATSEAAGYAALAEAAGWRPYPKDAALSAAEDAGLKHGGAIADDAIKPSSELAPMVVDGKTITSPAHMCCLGKPGETTDTTAERRFAPSNADAATGGAWVQVRLAADGAEPVFACGAVMVGSGIQLTDFKCCWKGTAFQVSMDGEEWTNVAGGEVSTDGRATWTPVGADGIFRRTAAMKASDQLHCRWDVAHRCCYVRAVLKESAVGTPSQMQWEVLKLKAGV
jgi:trimeric autotransporter adhesin